MGHRCGINCYRKRGRRSDCPSCKNSKKQAKLAHIKKGRRYARKVMSNPHPYRSVARLKHPEPTDEQIEETLADPYTAEPAPHDFNRVVYYSYIPDAGSGKWLEVVVQDDRLFNAYFRRDLLKSWGRP